MEQVYLSLMKRAAIAGGDILMKHFAGSYEIHKKGTQDIVTTVDLEAEKMIIRIIENIFPKHNILSEEKGLLDKKSEFTWIIDPLDGTKNYIRKIPLFANSIALEKKGEVLLAMIYLPITQELVTAFKGGGAYINDKPLEKLQKKDIPLEDIFLGICHGEDEKSVQQMMKYFTSIRPHIHDMRKLGSTCFEMTHVARGFLHGFLGPGIAPWDYKAASLIVKEVGGTVKTIDEDTICVFAPSVEEKIQKIMS